MADVLEQYYQNLLNLNLADLGKIKVGNTFYAQMRQINRILSNDITGFVNSILEFMIEACNTDLTFNTNNFNYTKVFEMWQKDLNTDLNIDIPRGMRSFSEQYYRERLSSSFIVLRGKWGDVDGVTMPTKMWLMDGASIYVKDDKEGFNNYRYYFGKPKDDDSNELPNNKDEFTLIRKPYNKWTDTTPTPYLVKTGALYQALFQEKILNRQAEIISTPFPIGTAIKMGCAEAMKSGKMPTEDDLKDMKEKWQNLRADYNTHPFSRGVLGVFPFDVNFEHIMPDYAKALDDKIIKPSERKLLAALGMIEFKGFSSNREEAILNPKVLVERCVDAVLDYVELLDDVVDLIRKKNATKTKTSNIEVRIQPGIIKAFIDDKMRAMIRNWYDRGLISKEDALEATTMLNFKIQVQKRQQEEKDNINKICYPQIVTNLEQYGDNSNQPKDDDEVPDDKKPGSPESKNFKNASIDGYVICENCGSEIDYDDEPEAGMGYIKCPICEIAIDQTGKCYLTSEDEELVIAPYQSVNQLPDSVKNNMTKELQRVFMNVVNNSLKNGDSEEVAFKKAWSVLNKIAHKNSKNKWIRNKK
jgi:cation transport regulator